MYKTKTKYFKSSPKKMQKSEKPAAFSNDFDMDGIDLNETDDISAST